MNQLEGGVKAIGTVAHANEKNQRIELIMEDRRIMKIISKQLNVDMKSISFEANDGIFEGLIKVMVYDTEHLDALTKQFEQIDGVERIERWDFEDSELIHAKD